MSDEINGAPVPTEDQSVTLGYKVTIDQCRFKSCLDDSESPVGNIADDGLTLSVGNWTARISHEAPGRLVFLYEDPITTEQKPFYRDLRNGVVELTESPEPRVVWHTIANIQHAMYDDLGITDISRIDPNIIFTCTSCQHEAYDGRHHFCFALTDGEVSTSLIDDIAGSFDPNDPESMFFYNGRIIYNVQNARWAIIGEAITDADSSIISNEITLCAGHGCPNLYLLMLELDDYLLKNNRGNFGDYIGELKDLV